MKLVERSYEQAKSHLAETINIAMMTININQTQLCKRMDVPEACMSKYLNRESLPEDVSVFLDKLKDAVKQGPFSQIDKLTQRYRERTQVSC